MANGAASNHTQESHSMKATDFEMENMIKFDQDISVVPPM